ncbi:MAG TPA: metallopeptidase family protein, partial [Gemmatimonadales bacterium]|nr:metallopeptidase family protein [Gemmatimonadales bacterium]
MRFDDFETLVARLARDVPAEFLDGVVGIEVSPKTLPDPVRRGVYTLGQCIAVPAEQEEAAEIQSRIVLYHGSFAALARDEAGFDWRGQAWETLTHELRHHLEWRARVPDLERFDEAAEQNFNRAQGEPFDPLFHLAGETVAPGVTRIDDD